MSTIAFQQPHLRITRRGRAVLTLLIAIPLAIGAAVTGIGAIGAAAGTHAGTTTFQYVTVESGESLWQVAQAVAPTADPRDVVANILSLNDLNSGEVQPGQRLAIPVQYSVATRSATGH
ncbi:MAG: LysM peptidoglycan-binding domain-containing protein [Pseudolysinimonas sp.]